jgi:hypothetical protein
MTLHLISTPSNVFKPLPYSSARSREERRLSRINEEKGAMGKGEGQSGANASSI